MELCFIDDNGKSILCRYFGIFIGGGGMSLVSSIFNTSWLRFASSSVSLSLPSGGTNSGISNTFLRSLPLRITYVPFGITVVLTGMTSSAKFKTE